MTATEALERRIDELCRENERLRGQVASLIGRSFRTADKMNCLNIENVKLRELVAALADCRNTTCADCVRWDYPEGGCSLDGVMRELGLEVE